LKLVEITIIQTRVQRRTRFKQGQYCKTYITLQQWLREAKTFSECTHQKTSMYVWE